MADNSVATAGPLRLRSFIEIIESPWPFRWQSLALFAVFGISIGVSSEYNRLSHPSLLVATLVSGLAVLVTIGLVAVAGLILRPIGRLRITVLIPVLIAIGAIRAAITTAVVDALNLDRDSFLLSRILFSTSAVPVLLVVSSFVAATVSQGRREQRESRKDISELRAERDALLADLARADDLIISESDGTLRPQIDSINSSLASSRKPSRAALADALDNLVTTVVRPLSHALAARAATHRNSSEAVAVVAPAPVFPTAENFVGPFVAALAMYIATVIVLFDAAPLVNVFEASFASGFVMWAGLWFFKRMLAGYTFTIQFISTVVILTHLGLGLLVVWLDLAFFLDFPNEVDISTSVIMSALIPGLVYVAQRLLLHQQSLRLAQLATVRREMALQVSEVRRRAWFRQRHIAHALHSAIQSRVHAEAQLLRSGAGPITDSETHRVTTTLAGIFEVLHNTAGTTTDAVGELRRAIEFWSGMCSIEFTLPRAVEKLLTRNSDIGETVLVTCLEVINNAIRHGKATRLSLAISLTADDVLSITAINNGKSVDSFTPGLGMSMFDELTVHWSLQTQGDNTVFTGLMAARHMARGNISSISAF